MKFPLCLLALLCSTTAAVQAAPATEPVAAPVVAEPLTQKDGLKVSIGSIELRASDPHVNVVLQNTSTKSIRVFHEWNSWGWSDLSLEIQKVDDKVFDKPIVVYREAVPWRGNMLSFDTIEPGEAIVREVRFQMPVQDRASQTRLPRGLYQGFPFLGPEPHHLTMRAVFANDDETSGSKSKSWMGRIASPFKNYQVGWDDN